MSLLSQLSSLCPFFQSSCYTLSTTNFSSLTISVFTAIGSLFQGHQVPDTNSFSQPQVITAPPALHSPLPPPPWLGRGLVAGKTNPATPAIPTLLISNLKKGPSGRANQATPATPTVPGWTTRGYPMTKQRLERLRQQWQGQLRIGSSKPFTEVWRFCRTKRRMREGRWGRFQAPPRRPPHGSWS